MSLLSLLSKEQGVTVLGVCAAFDVFIHWDSVMSLWRRKTLEQVSEKTEILSKASSVRNSHINGLSSNIPRINNEPRNVVELRSMALRISKNH